MPLLLAGALVTTQAAPSFCAYKLFSPAPIKAASHLPASAGSYKLGRGTALAATPNAALVAPTEAVNSFFGQSVAGIGDINGDGYADALVGAYGAANFQGQVYLYLGSKGGLEATPSRVLADPSEMDHDYFGSSIAGVGDVNKDGYGDVLIGANGANGQQGKVYLYLGSRKGLSLVPSSVINDPAATRGDNFGSSVAKVDDVNGDGFADVLIGTKRDNAQPGQAYLFLGECTGLGATPAVTFQDPGAYCGDNFGSSVTGAGDVNGDGYADLLIGSPNSVASQGRAYLYLGSRTGISTAPTYTLKASNEVAGNLFGYCVSNAGDTNGDGYADVLVGAYGTADYQGRAYLYLGSAAGLTNSTAMVLTAPNTSEGDQFGALGVGLGDINNDGYADVLLGSNGAQKQQGKAYVYLGSHSSLHAAPAFVLNDPGTAEFDLFGTSASALGDINGDGATDVLVGAYGTDLGRGKAYVYLGAIDLKTPPVAQRPLSETAETSPWQAAVYPNPYVAGLTAQLTTSEVGLITLTLADAAGRVVLHRQQMAIAGNQVLNLETSQALPSGYYTLLVRQNQHTGTVRLIHQ